MSYTLRIVVQLLLLSHAMMAVGAPVPPPNDRLQKRTQGDITVNVAVPDATEVRELFGADLYAQNIQPVWVSLRNDGEVPVFLSPMGIDHAYYAPREALQRVLAAGQSLGTTLLENAAIRRIEIPPRSQRAGYVFTRVDEGTKSFNVDVFSDTAVSQMSFFVPVPGLQLDHHDFDRDALYSQEEIRELALPDLVAALESMPCCVRDGEGEDRGDPLNLVLIGQVQDLYYAFMRAGWDETETIYANSLIKTAVSALTGGRYRYSPVSALYVFDRAQDVALQRARSSIHERNHLRLWMTPLQFDGQPVWLGQISRDIGVRFTTRTITTHKIDPDVDETREFLLEDLAYTQGLRQFGYVGGVGAASYDEPRSNLTGDPYFTDGKRIVMWLSGTPTALNEVEFIDLSAWHTGLIGD
ncbi:hypothetical protein G8770_00090 [Aestuariicella hydrocarbonica]|uniref:LssY-like C-terminal domain-containing protein n=1 Tax=Pseudomaricurvus hydrocarbonicus TaxID=1470433 RepID=A0A9E5JXM9_9GAMM|nr:LssY C-terminal domain-containing protein [Aestuariicella hydrocarbonica]NHO63947.1 hypothetical protein [Aestuariicella hydrocarbonica]